MAEEQILGRTHRLGGNLANRLLSGLPATIKRILGRKAKEQTSEEEHTAVSSQDLYAPPAVKEEVESESANENAGRFTMPEEQQVTEAEVTPEVTAENEDTKVKAKGRDVLDKLKGALDTALAGRGNVIMVRVNDETLKAIDMLVEADVCKSRSEGAAFLINQGIQASSDLYDRIGGITEQIAELKARLRQIVAGDSQE